MLTDERDSPMIVAQGLTKYYGRKVAIDRLSVAVRPGVVTGLSVRMARGQSARCKLPASRLAPRR